MTNADRLRAELEFLTAHLDLWDQANWVLVTDRSDVEPGADWTCGTTACLAGWTALHDGFRPDPRHDTCVLDDAGRYHDVGDVARRTLGLTDYQADVLFSAENNLRDLWEFARLFTDGAIVVPPEVIRTELPYTFTGEYDVGDGDGDGDDPW